MYKETFKKKKKNLYSKEDSEDEEILFMGKITQEDDSNVEGEVDLKVEIISSLEELRKSIMKNKYLKEQLLKYQKEVESLKQEVVKFKREVERLKD